MNYPTFEAWAEEINPQALRTYERSRIDFATLTKGKVVMSLVGGYGAGTGGRLLKITSDVSGEYPNRRVEAKELSGGNKSTFVIPEHDPDKGFWYQIIAPMDDHAAYIALPYKDAKAWQMLHLGVKFGS